MADNTPSILLYGQALALLQTLQDNYNSGVSKSVDEVSTDLRNILNRFERSLGQPLTRYEPVEDFEPPSSTKMNRFWHTVTQDVALLQHQLDILQASAILTHNFIKTEILNAQQQNAIVNNKLKVLQLYTNIADPKVFTFGDSFTSTEFIDNSSIDPTSQASTGNGSLVLGTVGDLINLSKKATVTVLPESNGFLGDNQEIDDPIDAPVDPLTHEKIYTFKATTDRKADTASILDGSPDTWIEYEHNLVSDTDRASASNFNFTYLDSATNTQVDWASGPSNNVLNLGLQFQFDSANTVNFLSYSPFGLADNSNFPVLVKLVEVSADGTNWKPIDPPNVWIGTEANLRAASTADNVTIGNASWNFGSTTVQYLRIHTSQPNPVTSFVGHLYYLDDVSGSRVEGPVPPIENPARFYQYSSGNPMASATQHTEYFVGKRWVVGVRDVTIQQINYATASTMVSTLLHVPGVVDRVSLDADVNVPSEFASDQAWVQFYISADNGNTWTQISRIEDNALGIPEILAFNDPLPAAFKDPAIGYVTTISAVNSLRVKIVLNRPNDLSYFTPEVRSYQLKVRLR